MGRSVGGTAEAPVIPINGYDWPQQGLTFAETLAALQVFCASPKLAGLVITEFNPDHDDQDGALAKQLIDCLAQVLQQGGFAQPAC
jgi:hypothetical protein